MSFDRENQNISPKASCCQCGQILSVSEMLHYQDQWICSECKPLYFQKVREGISVPGTFQYGGFWIRFLAKLLDSFILSTVSIVFLMVFFFLEFLNLPGSDASSFKPTFSIIASIAELLITIGYTIYFVGKFGATPGKMICQLKIITAEGEKVTYGRAAARFFAEMLSSFTMGIGYLMVVFNDEKKALHDVICNTRVIRTNR